MDFRGDCMNEGRQLEEHVTFKPLEDVEKTDFNDHALFSLLSINIPKLDEKEIAELHPLSLCLVIDVSGSMAGGRIRRMKSALEQLIKVLRPVDRVSIVLFSHEVEVLIPLTFCEERNLGMIVQKIKDIQVNGQTNISGGLTIGLDILSRRVKEGKDYPSLLLFTDGEANRGLVKTKEIMKVCYGHEVHPPIDMKVSGTVQPYHGVYNSFRDVQNNKFRVTESKNYIEHESISINTFGCGMDHSSGLLMSISKEGNGTYYFINKPEEIKICFMDCLNSLKNIMFENITINITPTAREDENKMIMIRRIRNTHGYSRNPKDGSFSIFVKNLRSLETQEMMIEMIFNKEKVLHHHHQQQQQQKLQGGPLSSSSSLTLSLPILEIDICYEDRFGEEKCGLIIGEFQHHHHHQQQQQDNKKQPKEQLMLKLRIEEYIIRQFVWVRIGEAQNFTEKGTADDFLFARECFSLSINKILSSTIYNLHRHHKEKEEEEEEEKKEEEVGKEVLLLISEKYRFMEKLLSILQDLMGYLTDYHTCKTFGTPQKISLLYQCLSQQRDLEQYHASIIQIIRSVSHVPVTTTHIPINDLIDEIVHNYCYYVYKNSDKLYDSQKVLESAKNIWDIYERNKELAKSGNFPLFSPVTSTLANLYNSIDSKLRIDREIATLVSVRRRYEDDDEEEGEDDDEEDDKNTVQTTLHQKTQVTPSSQTRVTIDSEYIKEKSKKSEIKIRCNYCDRAAIVLRKENEIVHRCKGASKKSMRHRKCLDEFKFYCMETVKNPETGRMRRKKKPGTKVEFLEWKGRASFGSRTISYY